MNARNGIFIGCLLLAAALLPAAAALVRTGRSAPSAAKEEESPPEPELRIPPEPAGYPVALAAKNPFHPLRGAPPPEEKKEPSTPVRQEPPGSFALTGIFTFGEERGAVIASGRPATGKPGETPRRIFRAGAEIGGYSVSEIQADRVILVRGNEKLILHLYQQEEKTMREKKP